MKPNPKFTELEPDRKNSHDATKKEEDTKSVFVQNVDYGATMQELQAIFQDCGTIVRVTILKEKVTNKPKGCAYIEFSDIESVTHAMMLSGSRLRNRAIKVSHKRTNIRGITNNSHVKQSVNDVLITKLMMTKFGPKR